MQRRHLQEWCRQPGETGVFLKLKGEQMPLTKSQIDREREVRTKFFGERFSEPEVMTPQVIAEVPQGSFCRLWFMPNQTPFVVVGSSDESFKVILPDGVVQGFMPDTWVVVLDQPRVDVTGILDRITAFREQMRIAAWGK